MTKREAHEWLENTFSKFTKEEDRQESIFYLIKKIYNNFENRSCDNCKYNKKEDEFMIFCDAVMCKDGSKMMWHSFTKDFYCNTWESKDE